LLIASLLCCGFGEADLGAVASRKEAVRRMQAGDLAGADQILQKALGNDPTDPQLHFELANLYPLRHDETKKVSEKKRKRKKEARGDIRLLEQAARELEQAVMLQPNFIAAHYNLGVVYKRQGRYVEARNEFREVLKIDPSQISAHMQIGAVYEEQGFFDAAEDSYRKALESRYDDSIHGAIEDLDIARREAHERAQREAARRMTYFREGFDFTPGSRARGYMDERFDAAEAQAGFAQAIPYLGTMLFDQFMNVWDSVTDGE